LLFHLLADSTRPVHNHRLVAGLGTEITLSAPWINASPTQQIF
jgi:hypothetical protein